MNPLGMVDGKNIVDHLHKTHARPTSKGNRAIVVSTVEIKNQKDEVVIKYEATRMLAGRDGPAK